MRVLDLFSGLEGWSRPFRERGHEVFTVDMEPGFRPDLVADVLEMRAEQVPFRPTVVTASVPCEPFSVAALSRNWRRTMGGVAFPKSERAAVGIRLLERTRELIDELRPDYWVIENPRGMMRRVAAVRGLRRATVTYCQYGETRMKPTDLWGVFPPGFPSRRPCKSGDRCQEAAPRGARTGTQGLKTAALRAEVPRALALELCERIERASGPASAPTGLDNW